MINCPLRVERPADRVIMFRSVLAIRGHIRSAYANTAVKMVRAAMLALVRGIMTFVKVCHLVQPSRYAASPSSSGMPM